MQKELYVAGGCFWGVEQYLAGIRGVVRTQAGYANGAADAPTYEEVCRGDTGHAEAVEVIYDSERLSLPYLLHLFYRIIDPTALNRQGPDVGIQYRTGIYYTEESDRVIIARSLQELQKKYPKPLCVEVKPLSNFFPAEEYHQKYLEKNPNGYCHIRRDAFEYVKNLIYHKHSEKELRSSLTEEQFRVTQEEKTERAFQNAYYDEFSQGIYVDVTTGAPLFLSSDKFESGCGWPSFSKPLHPDNVYEKKDSSFYMNRTEVRSTIGDAHLGHVFEDGPAELGGLRYCMNSASLRFIPKDCMEEEGYGSYLSLLGQE